MSFHTKRAALALIAVLAAAACSNNAGVPSAQPGVPYAASQVGAGPDVTQAADTTSILKKLKKDVVIGSTVDPGNGDTGPHSISIVQSNYGLKKGQVIVCNFADSNGNAGKGTTVEVLNPKPGSTPATFVQSSKIAGCGGAPTTLGNEVCAAGMTGKKVACFDHRGSLVKAYGSPLVAPFDAEDAHCVQGPSCLYNAEYIFASDATTGGIVDWSVNNYGNPHEIQVASGFAVNKQTGWNALGPSGLSYDAKPDLLYIADGSTNTVVAFTNASSLLVKNEIVVLKGGKTFKCKYSGKQNPCGKLIYSGSPLNAPVAMTVLPNHNVIVANSSGGNTLVEIAVSTGKVLATKVVDKSTTQGIFALKAIGSNDSNTALYYTDTNDNSLHELEQ
jgi:hypothetical protein